MSENKPNDKISIIIPVYKVENYIQRCLDSVLNQTYTNLEIILVDDGSPDNSGKICDEYAEKDSRITVIHKENGGLSDARNVGITRSSGEWILFVDSDDCVSPFFAEALYRVVTENDHKIAQCKYTRFYEDIPNVDLENFNSTIVSSYDILKNIDCSVNTAACNKIYKSDLFDNIKFPKSKIHEDVATTYKLFAATDNICIIDAGLYYYFSNPDSITTSKIKNNKLDLIDAYAEQVEFFRQKDFYQTMFNKSANNLAAVFGTLASYKKEKYENYNEFYKNLVAKYKVIRPVLKQLPLRFDLKISVALSYNSLFFAKLINKLKNALHR